MTAKILLKTSDRLTDFSLTAIVEQETEGKYQAMVLGLPECKAEGNTREEAIANLDRSLAKRLEKAELISLEIPESKPNTPALTVLIEQQTDRTYQAMVLGFSECKAEGNSREEAITNISRIAGNRLEKSELIYLEIKKNKPDNPWMKLAGKYKDDPQFEAMQADIEAYRRELDAEMEEYYRKQDAEEVSQ
jgi:predicted RNase H-like HicB family nuclease